MVIQNGYNENDELLQLAQPATQPTAQPAAPDWTNVKNQLLQQWGGFNPQYMQGTLKQSGLTMDQLAEQFAQQAYKAGITDLSKLKLGSTTEKVMGPEATTDWGSPQEYDVTRNYLTFGDGDDAKQIGYVGAGEGRQYLDDPDALNRVMYSYAFADKPTDSLGRLFGTAEGGGWTAGEVVQGPDGQLMIVPKWGDSSDKGDILKVAQMGLMFVPGAGQGLGSLIAGGLGQAAQTAIGNALIGGTMSKLSGGDFLKGAVTAGAGSMLTPALGDLGSAATKALDLTGPAADVLKNAISGAGRSAFGAAVSGNSIADALVSGGLSGAATGAMKSTVGDLKLPTTITDPLTAAATAALTGKDVGRAAGNALLGALMKGAREGNIKTMAGLGDYDPKALEALQQMDPVTTDQLLRELGLQDYDFSALDRDLSAVSGGDEGTGGGYSVGYDFDDDLSYDWATDATGTKSGGEYSIEHDFDDDLSYDWMDPSNETGMPYAKTSQTVGTDFDDDLAFDFVDPTTDPTGMGDAERYNELLDEFEPGDGNLEQDFVVQQNKDGAQVADTAGNRGYFDDQGNWTVVTGEDPNELAKIMTQDTVTGGSGADKTKDTGGTGGTGGGGGTQTQTSGSNDLFALLAMLGMFGDNGDDAPQQPALMDLSGVKSIQDIFGDYFTKRG